MGAETEAGQWNTKGIRTDKHTERQAPPRSTAIPHAVH